MTIRTLPATTANTQSRMELEIERAILTALGVLVAVVTFVTCGRLWVIDPEMMTATLAIIAIVAMLGGVAYLAARHKLSDGALEALSLGDHDRRVAVVQGPWR